MRNTKSIETFWIEIKAQQAVVSSLCQSISNRMMELRKSSDYSHAAYAELELIERRYAGMCDGYDHALDPEGASPSSTMANGEAGLHAKEEDLKQAYDEAFNKLVIGIDAALQVNYGQGL